ncbi:MAG: phospholipase D-like domain-containing protein [Candidatus Dependentiae bacterium]|nr:phospholipase D-like domain-containing protein [Candidatus Dependentiae bacterium]
MFCKFFLRINGIMLFGFASVFIQAAQQNPKVTPEKTKLTPAQQASGTIKRQRTGEPSVQKNQQKVLLGEQSQGISSSRQLIFEPIQSGMEIAQSALSSNEEKKGGEESQSSQQEASEIAFAREQLIKNDDTPIGKAFFASDGNLRQVVVGLIKAETTRISVAMYTFTDDFIAEALIEARKRGIIVEVVLDSSQLGAQYDKFIQRRVRDKLIQGGVSVYVWPLPQKKEYSYSLMHNKFIIFDTTLVHRILLLTGSYNFTEAAFKKHQENALIIENGDLVVEYVKEFERLKENSRLLNPNNLSSSPSSS